MRCTYIRGVDARVGVRVRAGEGHGGAGRATSAASNLDLDAHGIELGTADRDRVLERDDLVTNKVASRSQVLWQVDVERVAGAWLIWLGSEVRHEQQTNSLAIVP